MIPAIRNVNAVQAIYVEFIETLKARGFKGELSPDYANRVVLSTDNSIYQVLPQGVIYPKHSNDLKLIARLAAESSYRCITLSMRGGGTGTNGQSLTDGLIVDVSKHMNRILEINAEERWVRVESGVVKDQLNASLKPYGLFFAPELSTSNRATIGGMINTDASGQGSCMYGKTRDHVLELKTILLGGLSHRSSKINSAELTASIEEADEIGSIYQTVNELYSQHKDEIERCFPKLNRCLTGYDLAHIRDEEGNFDLNSILCGAEGSLGMIAEAKLNVLPIPKYSALVNIKYDGFETSLRDAKALVEWGPTSIETIDSKVLNLAMGDIVWESVKQHFPQSESEPEIRGINLVEYTSDDEAELRQKVERLAEHLTKECQGPTGCFGYTLVYGATEINKIWGMRKKAVGLLGNAKGEERPIPFVEDTAVPPENLADFIMEFRKVLDDRGLAYGMFGHVDAGVLHVRPAIDMKDPKQEKLIREITDQVVQLTQKYNGLLWGEHGKGVRSEYSPAFFGTLYPVLQQIKSLFDPYNQLNPGKIATPFQSDQKLLKIDRVPTRGQHDRQIPAVTRDTYASAMFCNGNGACYNYDPKDAMCPSWKGTRQRIHSPKGRASLIREWLRLMAEQGVDLGDSVANIRSSSVLKGLPSRIKNTLAKRRGEYDYSNEVHEAMMGCLACKSCVGQCPIKVNVPDFRARFLELYYSRYLRPAKDYMIGGLEFMIPAISKWPAPYNWAMSNGLIKSVFSRFVGMIDSPSVCTHSLRKALLARGKEFATIQQIEQLSDQSRQKSVILVQDAFTSYFETELVVDLIDCLELLGFNVLVAPYLPNGKPLHVHGFMDSFEKAAIKNSQMLAELAASGLPMIGVDPSMTLTYRQEYGYVEKARKVNVKLIQEWLAEQLDGLATLTKTEQSKDYHLLAHCTEKTSAAPSLTMWKQIFSKLGLNLIIEPVGCCGMSGTYGHETANRETSEKIYQLSWAEWINREDTKGRVLATGYSCRSQVKRLDNQQIQHPIQALLSELRASKG